MKHILLVDDDLAFRQPLAGILEREGFAVQTAANGTEAMALYRQRPADLLILELILPMQDGLEVLGELRRTEPGLRIIVMSGGGRFVSPGHLLRMAEYLEADATLAKPFSRDEIQLAIARLLPATHQFA